MIKRLNELVNDYFLTEPDLSRFAVENLSKFLADNGVVAPPCKVGDMVYTIGFEFEANGKGGIKTTYRVYEDEVISIILSECGVEIHTDSFVLYAEDIGKELFLTLEEAEQALAERRK